jgi:2-iminobutanoate/2-iminopropanoate deaminase
VSLSGINAPRRRKHRHASSRDQHTAEHAYADRSIQPHPKVGSFITIGATAGVDPATGQLSGPDIESQTRQIFDSFKVMLESVGSDLPHIVHVTVFLSQMSDFDANTAYVEKMGNHRPARTVIGVRELPKPGVLLTVNLTAVTSE